MKKISEKMLEVFPDWFFGKSSVIKQKCTNNYGLRDWRSVGYRIRLRNAKMMLIFTIIFVFSLIMALLIPDSEQSTLHKLNRPEYGENVRNEEVKARLSYQGEILDKYLRIKLPPKQLTEDQKKQILSDYIKKLPSIILADNDGLNSITSDLFLPEKDPETNISIKWDSSSPELINNKGDLDSLNASKGGELLLTAKLTLDDVVEDVSIPLTVVPVKVIDHKRALEKRLSDFIEELEQRLETEDEVVLPTQLNDDISIEWTNEKRSILPVMLAIFGFGYLILFFKRYDGLEKEFKLRKEAIIDDFPDFIDKLILLLNAGLVTDAALRKIAIYYKRYASKNKKKPLYEGLVEIHKRIDETNTPLVKELREFAIGSGVRELIRFATIVEDNINKGSKLTDKLQGEGSLLWLGKKKRAEEKGRLAETKMTFPLVLLLLSIIMITTAPVLLEI
ncbi:MAG: hypothetical protein GX076_09640 [Clostridiales bacterium]|nr:hypothetical protein [Clostridiales bacterium]